MKRLLLAISMFAVAAALGLRAQRPYVPPVETLPGPPVEQPIAYSHKLHAGTLGLKCADCHKSDKDGFRMNYPAEEKCMACHSAIAVDSPHIQKLAEFAAKAESVPWVPIYRVPAFVWFAHDSHTEAAVACEVCHGPVAERDVLFKEKPTNMTSCMQCHAEHNAPNDCDFCHDPG